MTAVVQAAAVAAAARLAPAALTNDKPTVKSSGQKLSMRGLLHVLWDRAELTHWHPKMAGKRSWFVVRRALLEAAASCRAKQEALPHVLFVPESFKIEEKEEIRARRRAALARVYASQGDMMVVVGEIKEIVPAPLSTMPTGLLNNYSREDILDLFAYITSLKPADGRDGLPVMAAQLKREIDARFGPEE